MDKLEIPLGKRTKLYRFLEILPGMMSYGVIALLFIFSMINPAAGALYLLMIIAWTFVKAITIAFRTIQGYEAVKQAGKVNWLERLNDLENPHAAYERRLKENKKEFEAKRHLKNLKNLAVSKQEILPSEVYQAVVVVAYNEGLETLTPSIEALKQADFDKKRMMVVLGYEERGGEKMEETARLLKKKYEGVFDEFLLVKHPDGLKGEIKGKGPNLTYAAGKMVEVIKKKKIDRSKVIVTSLDSDNRVSREYFAAVAYEFVVREDRQRLSYQPVSLFTNNIWDAPAPMRVIATSNSFFNVIVSMRPHALRNFASHSQPLEALIGMGFWSKRTIVEDGHQYWRSLFYFKGDYEVVSIKAPIYQDAVLEETLIKTMKAQFIQLRRWDYGASDVAYVGVRLFSRKRLMNFWSLLPKFVRLLDGHVTLAAMSPIVAFGGWIPKLFNMDSRDLLIYNLPNIVSWVQMFASIGLMITILLSLKMLPERPKRYRRTRTFGMVLQWLLVPVIAIVYQSLAAFYAQTRLMLGLYMEKFEVTKKTVKV